MRFFLPEKTVKGRGMRGGIVVYKPFDWQAARVATSRSPMIQEKNYSSPTEKKFNGTCVAFRKLPSLLPSLLASPRSATEGNLY